MPYMEQRILQLHEARSKAVAEGRAAGRVGSQGRDREGEAAYYDAHIDTWIRGYEGSSATDASDKH